MSCFQLGAYLEFTVEQWASTNPSISRIYIIFGYDLGLGIMDEMLGIIGHRFRLMRHSPDVWKSHAFRHARSGPAGILCYDGLPGILADDRDFFD